MNDNEFLEQPLAVPGPANNGNIRIRPTYTYLIILRHGHIVGLPIVSTPFS